MASGNKKKKSKIILLRLIPEDPAHREGPLGGFYYTTTRNPKMEGGHNGKLRLMKYHPGLKKHVWFIENKKLK